MQNKCHKKLAIEYYFHIDILFYYTLKGKKKIIFSFLCILPD